MMFPLIISPAEQTKNKYTINKAKACGALHRLLFYRQNVIYCIIITDCIKNSADFRRETRDRREAEGCLPYISAGASPRPTNY